MNMFKPNKAKTSEEYFEMLTGDRKQVLIFLDKLIKETAPSLKPNFIYNMPGYGSFKYKNYKKDELNWPTIAIASQKNYISVYVCAIDGDKYVAEKYKDDLGKVSVGKSCIRFKKIEDINLDVLKQVIKEAAKSPGLVLTSK